MISDPPPWRRGRRSISVDKGQNWFGPLCCVPFGLLLLVRPGCFLLWRLLVSGLLFATLNNTAWRSVENLAKITHTAVIFKHQLRNELAGHRLETKWEMSREWGWALRCALCSASLGVGARREGEQRLSVFAACPGLCRGPVSKENGNRAVLLFLITKEEWEVQQVQGEEPKWTNNTVSWGASITRLLLTGPLRPDQSGADTTQGSLKIRFWYPKWILHPENYVLKEFPNTHAKSIKGTSENLLHGF